jgi:hypothetical protein
VALSVQLKNKLLIRHVWLISIYRRTLLITKYYISNHVHGFQDILANIYIDMYAVLLYTMHTVLLIVFIIGSAHEPANISVIENYCLLGRNAVKSAKILPTFRGHVLPPFKDWRGVTCSWQAALLPGSFLLVCSSSIMKMEPTLSS